MELSEIYLRSFVNITGGLKQIHTQNGRSRNCETDGTRKTFWNKTNGKTEHSFLL